MRKLSLRAAAALCLLALATPAFAARDYYVSASGDDTRSGGSPETAWRTIARLNSVSFEPGDRILLEGGATFAGRLFLDAADRGTPDAPIFVTSYGAGRATIHAGNGTAIQIYNTAGIHIGDLAVVGSGPAANTGSGVSAYTDLPGDVKLRFIVVEDLSATGFGKSGVEVGGNNGRSGFEDVIIRSVEVWDIGRQGILTYGPSTGAHRNVSVTRSRAHHVHGVYDPRSTGNGIVLGSVDGGLIERSVAAHNGANASGPNGPVGIWTYLSNDVTIQYNESHNNRTGGKVDGGGFGLDVGVTNSRVQYNYTHDNDGAGILLAGGRNAVENADNIVRFNISQNDGRKNGYAAIHVWGRTRNTHFYNNTIFIAPDDAARARALYVTNVSAEGFYPVGVSFRNNIVYVQGGLASVEATAEVLQGASVRFENNNYYSTTGGSRFIWGTSSFSSLAAWADATGQERTSAGLLGTTVDPRFVAPGEGPTLDDAFGLNTIAAYMLQEGSPLIDAGQALTGFDLPVDHDFFGTPLPQGPREDVGAHEFSLVTGDIVIDPRDKARTAGAWTTVSDATAAGGVKWTTADRGWSQTSGALPAPTHYVDVPFLALGDTPYRLWLRLRARNDSKWNDSVYVQFDNAVTSTGAPLYRTGTTASLTTNMAACSDCALEGWGWHNGAYWLRQATDIRFAATGQQTIRVQVREDGIELDQIVLSPATFRHAAPGPPTGDDTILSKPAAPASGTTPPREVVIYASDIAAPRGWTRAADATAAGGAKLSTADNGWSSTQTALASPATYFDVTFTAQANTRYRLWVRVRARGDSKWNDSIYAQFSDAVDASGAPVYRIGTTQALTINKATCSDCPLPGWGWQSGAYWLPDTGEVWFSTSGTRTLRLQLREDGVEVDQIVLSPAAFLTSAPGPVNNDSTIVPKS